MKIQMPSQSSWGKEHSVEYRPLNNWFQLCLKCQDRRHIECCESTQEGHLIRSETDIFTLYWVIATTSYNQSDTVQCLSSNLSSILLLSLLNTNESIPKPSMASQSTHSKFLNLMPPFGPNPNLLGLNSYYLTTYHNDFQTFFFTKPIVGNTF